MSRDWEAEFAALGEEDEDTRYYPGSSHVIPRHPNRGNERARTSLAIDPTWDERPLVFDVGGKEMEFFTVGQFARALGRRPPTIRQWEREGIIPLATFQIPGKDDDARGRRRLYSRAQVEGVVAIAAAEGLFTHRRKPLGQTEFSTKVHDLFRQTTPKEN